MTKSSDIPAKSTRGADFDPVEFMRSRHPDLFSDSTAISHVQLSRELFAYHLETLTSRSQEMQFAYFCRRIAEKEICPNLRAQTGPTGGGDSKADSETIPVSSELSELWTGSDPKAGEVRWAFAFSAKKTWKSKVRADVASIVSTNRAYKRIYFITNQFARDKDRAAIEDELTSRYGVPTFILDRTWLTQVVFEHDRIALAVEALRIEEISLQSERQVGPRDLERQRELEEIEAEISDTERYAGAKYQLVEDCLHAAILARGLERPRAEVDGYFARAGRIAEEIGYRQQRLRIAYDFAWTSFFWYGDHTLLNSTYTVVESLTIGSDQAGDIELLQNLWQVLVASVWNGTLNRDEAKLDSRKQTLTQELDRLSADASRPNNALQAKTGRVLIDLYVAYEKHDPAALDEIWGRCSAIIAEAEHLGDYPLERFVNLIKVLGELGLDSAAFDSLFERALAALEKRRSEVAGGELLTDKGFQKLKLRKIYEAVRLFGRALERFIKHESRNDLIKVLMGLCTAYEQAGLLWAARNCALTAVERCLASYHERGDFNFLIIPSLKKLAWLELKLGRLPRIVEAGQLLSLLIPQFNLDTDRRKSLEEDWTMLDAIMGVLIIDASLDQLRLMERLPDAFERVGLHLPKVALLYALGYRDELRGEGFPKEQFSDADIDHFMKRMMEQPAKAQMPPRPTLMAEKEIEFGSIILGCSLRVSVANNDQSIYLAESLLGAVEAFFATSLDQRVLPYRSEARIRVEPSDSAPAPFTIGAKTVGGQQFLHVQHPPRNPIRTEEYRRGYRDMMMKAIGHVLTHIMVLDNIEGYFDSVAGDERGFSRALLFAEMDIISENIFGTAARPGIDDLLDGSERTYPLKRTVKWTEGIVFDDPKSALDKIEEKYEKKVDGYSSGRIADKPHRSHKVISLIDVPLWDRARWSATLYAFDPSGKRPPTLGLGFKDIAAGREIFQGLRAKIGSSDTDDELRIAILTGVDRGNPAAYNVVIGTNLDEHRKPNDDRLILAVSRIQKMTPSSTLNLERFLHSIGNGGCYFITPVHFDESKSTLPHVEMDLAIEKSSLVVRPAWQIGVHDQESVGIREDDDPIIPDDEKDAPILEVLELRRRRAET